MIFDAGAPVRAVLRELAGRTPASILLTHEHFDHIYYIAKYSEAFPNCPVYCHPATLEELKTGEFNTRAGYPVAPPASLKNFHALTDNQTVLNIKAIFAPGHSEGSIVYLVDADLFTGDVLFRNTIGRTDLIPNGPARMQTTLRRLQPLTYKTAHHGHGAPSTHAEQQQNIAQHIE